MNREGEILKETIEGVLMKHTRDAFFNTTSVKAATQELARERAIGFAEWASDNYWIREPFPRKTTGVVMWALYGEENAEELKTTSQLYDLFLSQLKEKL